MSDTKINKKKIQNSNFVFLFTYNELQQLKLNIDRMIDLLRKL
jgi:CRISPR/Cas system-associated endoribonuclease Cas2